MPGESVIVPLRVVANPFLRVTTHDGYRPTDTLIQKGSRGPHLFRLLRLIDFVVRHQSNRRSGQLSYKPFIAIIQQIRTTGTKDL